jgi:protease PrsW
MEGRTLFAILGGLAFLPPLLFALWVRNSEHHEREPLWPVLALFAYSATLGIMFTLLVNEFVLVGAAMYTAVLVAPFVEELTKGLGLSFVHEHIHEPEDGIVYGAAAGLGFAATENFLYAYNAYILEGVGAAIALAIARVFSSMLLHATSSALLGLGVALVVLRRRRFWLIPFSYVVAVGLHALYNHLVLSNKWVGFVSGIGMVVILSQLMRRGVYKLDKKTAAPKPATTP